MDYLTIDEVAERVKVRPETVKDWYFAGLLPAVDLGREEGLRIQVQDLEKFLAAQRAAGPGPEVGELQLQRDLTYCLCQWLRSENQALTNFYRDLEQVFLKIGEKIRSSLEMAVKSGDMARSKVYNEAMILIYKRWNKIRKRYQKWLLAQERKWEGARNPTASAGKGHFPETKLLTRAEELKELLRSRPKEHGEITPGYFSRLQQEYERLQKKFHCLCQEYEDLREHYLNNEKYLKKIARDLRAEAQKAGKAMDFIKGQVFNEALVSLYLEWEKPKQSYNQWLLEQEERWQKFKNELKV